MSDEPESTLDIEALRKGVTPAPWRVYVQEIADKEQAKRELCDLVEGTPNFQPRLVYVTDDDWSLAVCVTGCGERSEANAHAIVAMLNEVQRLRDENSNLFEAAKMAERESERLREALRKLLPADFDDHPKDFAPEWHEARATLKDSQP